MGETASNFSLDRDIAKEILVYAGRIVKRNYVSNTLGNIAIRVPAPEIDPHGVVYTKHRGVSLEQMDESHIVVTSVTSGELIFGRQPPSIGHQLSRRIMQLRSDVGAVIHAHVNEVISYFAAVGDAAFRYVANDTPLVLGGPVVVLAPSINIELDVSSIENFITGTNCVVMPNHGVTALGTTVSEAYHRLTSFSAEIVRATDAVLIARALGRDVDFIDESEVSGMNLAGPSVIYGDAPPPLWNERKRNDNL